MSVPLSASALTVQSVFIVVLDWSRHKSHGRTTCSGLARIRLYSLRSTGSCGVIPVLRLKAALKAAFVLNPTSIGHFVHS